MSKCYQLCLGDSQLLGNTNFSLSDRNGIERTYFSEPHLQRLMKKRNEHATDDSRQIEFKTYHHFVSENQSFVQNLVIQPTQLKALSTSCCCCYRRETFPSFTASLSFKMKCTTGFLSLFSHWLLNKSRFKPLHANKGCRENTELNICFDH